MATKTKTTKAKTTKSAKGGTTKSKPSPVTIKTKDGGTHTLKSGDAFYVNPNNEGATILKSGEVKFGSQTYFSTHRDNDTGEMVTFAMVTIFCEDGSIRSLVGTADVKDDVNIDVSKKDTDSKPMLTKDIRLIGLGNPLTALLVIKKSTYDFVKSTTGVDMHNSYTLVHLGLDRTSSQWEAVFIPTTKVLSRASHITSEVMEEIANEEKVKKEETK